MERPLQAMLDTARAGNPVYITQVHDVFARLPPEACEKIVCLVDLMDEDGQKSYEWQLPTLEDCNEEESTLVRDYFYAKIYNLLSSLGGRHVRFFVDTQKPQLVNLIAGLSHAFGLELPRKSRPGYGRAVNVLDRMIQAVSPGAAAFCFALDDLSKLPPPVRHEQHAVDSLPFFRASTTGLAGQAICGIDVGGTDIKAVLVVDGTCIAYKEYDWFPANFTRSIQLIEPIRLVVRVLQARLAIHRQPPTTQALYLPLIEQAMDKHATDETMQNALHELASAGLAAHEKFNALGLCFPDVVVKNKIVGGEVYKTRGIRNNPSIDYEADFAQLTHLDEQLKSAVLPSGAVRIINDGPMASFTAAVEMAFSDEAPKLAGGVFAHTLGTELGTGWISATGAIPDIPLEIYNFIIDLGCWPERRFESDDLRSVNNFNTGLPGTLQKYCSQSGVFRLALKYFPSERPDLFAELRQKGYVVERINAQTNELGYYVPTEPIDQRKAFLEHMMALPEREQDESNFKIWREVGEALAVTLLESKELLDPGSDERFLFGRLAKNPLCFRLMLEGARRIKPDISLIVAGSGLANPPLMQALEQHPEYNVAQFAQAIGAVYYDNAREDAK